MPRIEANSSRAQPNQNQNFPSSLSVQIFSNRDNQLSPIPVDFDPETLGWLLDEGGRGNRTLQNELFNTMEDTWERLRGDLNELKNAVCKHPFNLQPWTEKGKEPTASALEKSAFVEHVLHNLKAATWEGQHNFHGTIYELLDAVARGVAVLEIDLTVEDGKYIPGIVELIWGEASELPFLEVELDRAEKDRRIAERDKLLFREMGLPVSKQWLYDRHKVPAPGPDEDLFNPSRQKS